MAQQKREYGEKQITPRFQMAWPYLFEPDTSLDGKSKFKLTMLFDLKDEQIKQGLKVMKDECLRISQKAFGKTEGVKLPFRDGNEKGKYEGFADKIFITASTTRRPKVVGPNPKQSVLETDIYGGCYGRASLIPATYVMAGQPGITFYLQNVQKLAEGERFGGGETDPSDDFSAMGEASDGETVTYDEQDTLGF